MPNFLNAFYSKRSLNLAAILVSAVSIGGILGLLQARLTTPIAPVSAVEVLLSPSLFDGDFAAIEEHLAALHSPGSQRTEVSPEFEKKLNRVVAEIATDTGTFPIALRVLMQKSFPDANGQRLAMLVECFYYYKQAETHHLDESLKAVGASDEVLTLPNLTGLQALYFGEPLSRALFAEYRQLYQHLGGVKTLDTEPSTPLPALHKKACAPIAAAFTH